MNSFRPKPRVLLGVTGSIAAYKAVSLIRFLKKFSEVKVVLTSAGSHLVAEKPLAKASGSPVWTSLFKGSKPIPPGTPSGSHPLAFVPHIEYAKGADLVLIAPARPISFPNSQWELPTICFRLCVFTLSAPFGSRPP